MTEHFSLDVDPASLRAVVRRLRRAGSMLERRGTTVTDTPGEIGERWTGDAATSVKAEMTALGGQLTESSTRIEEAVGGLVTLAQKYDAALDRLPGLNRRWDDAIDDHRAAVRDIERDHDAADEPTGDQPLSRFDREENARIAGDRTTAADSTLSGTQTTLTTTFEELRTELWSDTRTAASALSTAMMVQAPLSPVLPGMPAVAGTFDWHQRVRDFLRDDLPLVADHYDVADIPRVPPDDWPEYLDDYGLEVPGEIDPDRGRELVAQLDDQLAQVEDLSPEERSRALNRWAEDLDPLDLSILSMVDAQRVGNLDGMPNPARYAANRVNLVRGIEEETATLSELWDPPPNSDHPQYAEFERLRGRIEMLERLRDGESAVNPDTMRTEHTPFQTLAFELPTYDGNRVTDDGRLAVVMGDLDTAGQVGTVVPGITNRIDNFGATMDKAKNTHDLVADSATIAWLGYDTPEFADSTSTEDAVEGGEALTDFLAGMVHDADAEQTIMAHSYGTLVTSQALQQGMRPDRVVLFGSPGLGEDITSKDDLGIPDDIPIYALRAPGDPVSITAGHGMDPVDMPGIIRLDTDLTGGEDVTGHSAYTNPDTDSLDNIAGVLAGYLPRPDGVEGGRYLETGGNPLDEDGLAGPFNQNIRNLVDELQAQVTPEQLAAFTGELESTLQNVSEGREIGFDDIPELTDLVRDAMDESDLGEHLTQEEFQQALIDAGFTDTAGEEAGDAVEDGIDDLDHLDDLEIPLGPFRIPVPDGLNEQAGSLLGSITEDSVTGLSNFAVDHLPSLDGLLDTADNFHGAVEDVKRTWGAIKMAPQVAEYLFDNTVDAGVDQVEDLVEGGRDLAEDVGSELADTYGDVRDSPYNPMNW